MTQQGDTGDGEQVLRLDALVRARTEERGWSLAEMERRSNGQLSKSRWQQLKTGARLSEFPEPATLQLMADVLEVEVTTVVLAAACSLGIPVRQRGPDLAQLLPAGTDRLSSRMRDALLTLIRAAVAESLEFGQDAGGGDLDLEWPKSAGPQNWGRNATPRQNENHA